MRTQQSNLSGKGRAAGFDKLDNVIEFAAGRGIFEQRGSWFWYDIGSTTEIKGKPVPMGPEKIANGMANLKSLASCADEVSS